ncbi:MAG: hypothetical protein Ct9H90mP15_05430 [Candidatus Neomarinimicrobiota bacterium]|nr:MAG: hypothetical protein Ct9H90mP15_05430 [Candidatus Neomarinimicrobiota bacterium]
MLGKLVKYSIKNNLKGLENLIGVPGTLGGALIMNAGAWGGEISNCLESVELIIRIRMRLSRLLNLKLIFHTEVLLLKMGVFFFQHYLIWIIQISK